MEIYQRLVSPILDRLDSEAMHLAAVDALHRAERTPGLVEIFTDRVKSVRLHSWIGRSVWLENPLLVAAGWSKTGQAIEGLARLGAGGVIVGTVPENLQKGNEYPRQWVVGPGVAINYLGFNSPGMIAVRQNLEKYKSSLVPIGISLGINKDVPEKKAAQAYERVADYLYDRAKWFEINVSSPNTPGLRKLQGKDHLAEIVQAVNQVMDARGRRKPVFVKIADLTFGEIADVIQVCTDNQLTGIVASNSTNNSEIKAKYGEKWRNQDGGLSGNDADYRQLSINNVAFIYREAGDLLQIMGVGGIHDGQTALEYILAGAYPLQLNTAIREEGPGVFGKINRKLVMFARWYGVSKISDLVGWNVGRYS